MLLCIDIGNSNIGWGIFQKSKLKTFWRTATVRDKTSDEWGLEASLFLQKLGAEKLIKKIDGIAISSVVPPLNSPFQEMCQKYFCCSPRFAGESLKIPLSISTDHPEEVGADLLVGAYSAFKQYGGPVIVVDFGTATTFSAVSKKGEFLGTSIAPGIAISAEALFSRAAKLPRVQITAPPSPIGKNTIHCMQSGLLYGFVGQAEKIIQMIKKELGNNVKVVATGGLADLISNETAEIQKVDPNLLLQGLMLLYEKL